MTENELVHSWRELLERYHSTSCALDRTLRDRHDLGFSEFEVLEQLVESCCDKLRADACRSSATGCSCPRAHCPGSSPASEADGLVTGTMCADDRRGIYVMLTDAGRAKHAAAAHPPRGPRRQPGLNTREITLLVTPLTANVS